MRDVASIRVRPVTLRAYTSQVRNVPATLKSIRLRDLKAPALQKHYSAVSASTARHLHAVIRSAIRYAHHTGLIASNPCRHIVLPRLEKPEVKFLTNDDAAKLLSVTEVSYVEDGRRVTHPNRYQTLFAFALSSGCRPSETLGLRWTDLDFDSGVVSIRRTLQSRQKKDGGGFFFAECKTRSSRRSIPLPAGIVAMLRKHKVREAEKLLKLGVQSDLIFTSQSGSPVLRRNLIRRYWKPCLEAAGLDPTLTLYCLRHSHASFLLNAGVSPKVIQREIRACLDSIDFGHLRSRPAVNGKAGGREA